MTVTHTTTATTAPTPPTIEQACAKAASRLRWEYTVAYRRRHRLPGVYPNNHDADQAACEHLRHHIPIVLAGHLPGIQLVEWEDPHPSVIDSTWRHGQTVIEVFWDYHPDWTIGDPSAITIHHGDQR